jgi:hypothetical protein
MGSECESATSPENTDRKTDSQKLMRNRWVGGGEVVVLRLDCERFEADFFAEGLGHSPAFESTILFETKTGVVRLGVMFLGHETRHCSWHVGLTTPVLPN